MPERGIARRAGAVGFATPTNAPVYVDSADNVLKYIPAGSGTSVVSIPQALSASGAKIAAGSGALVSGAVVVNTGLASVLAFVPILNGATGFATGATEVSDLLVSSITTGAVTVKGTFNSFVSGAASVSASGTGGFTWIAVGM